MTTTRRYRPSAQPASTGALTFKLALLGVVATLVIGSLLAAQMSVGADPALSPKAKARESAQNATPAAGASTPSSGDPYRVYGGNDDGYEGGYDESGDGDGYAYGDGYPSAPAAPPVTSSVS